MMNLSSIYIANDATFVWTNGITIGNIFNMFSKKEEVESLGNRAGDGIWTAGSGSGRDRAGTLPAEG